MAEESRRLKELGGVLHWVNSAKGIGIVLVILGHLLYGSNMAIVNKTIYSFHMPLFFILSGYVQKKWVSKGYIKKKAEKLLMPYLAFTIIWIPIYIVEVMKKQSGITDVIYDALYVKGHVSNNPLWFLVVLFEVFLFIGVTRLPEWGIRPQMIAWGVSLLCGWLVYLFSNEFVFLRLFGFNRAVVCTSFFLLGIIFRDLEERVKGIDRCPVVVICLFINIMFGTFINGKVSIYGFELGQYAYFQIAAITGTTVAIFICRRFLDKKCWLSQLSKYAILLLGSQYFIIRIFNRTMDIFHMMGTIWYDIFMMPVILFCIFFLPAAYERLQKHIPIIKLLNGE